MGASDLFLCFWVMKMKNRTWKIRTMLVLFILITLTTFYVPIQARAEDDSGYSETWNASTDPWKILSGNGGVAAGIRSIGGDTFMRRTVRVLRSTLVVLCLIGTMMSLIAIPFISNSAQLKERKEDLTHKALIFALSFAIFPILNFLKLLMDTQFGFR